ncbi:MAG: helix-turn-helix transcriptional regulator [Slackia sp.]|nr:helix-turn-helix transcriptional regulator [Slackia sp.]
MAYVLFISGRFSFSQTIDDMTPAIDVVVVEEEDADGQDSFDERCAVLADRARLTEHEREVFALLARGRNARFIQENLVVSYNTVKSHVSHIYAKLGVHTHQELIDLVELEGR